MNTCFPDVPEYAPLWTQEYDVKCPLKQNGHLECLRNDNQYLQLTNKQLFGRLRLRQQAYRNRPIKRQTIELDPFPLNLPCIIFQEGQTHLE